MKIKVQRSVTENISLGVRFLYLILTLCLTFTVSCDSGGSDNESGWDIGEPLPPVTIQEITVEMDEADWDTIKNSARSPEILIPVCGRGPFASPNEFVSATVTVDGETVTQAGVRTKGWWGSINPSHPSLVIDFDEFIDGQLLGDVERITLNNNNHDPSNMHTSFAFQAFRSVGYPAPTSGYAHVTVNGQDLGVYSSVEPIKKPFLRKWFESDEGHLYESQLSDFTPEKINSWEQKTDEETPYDRSDLDAVMTALEAGDDTLLAELGEIIDLDMFYTYWAMEVLISFWDGYNGNLNNCFLYNDPATGKFVFIPWGTDDTFRSKSALLPINSVGPLFANSGLSNRLYKHPAARAQFIAELERLYDIVWGDNYLQRLVAHTRTALQPYVSEEFNPGFNTETQALQQFMASHPGNVYSTLIAPATPPAYPYEIKSKCFPSMPVSQPFSIEFSTTWGSTVYDGSSIVTEFIVPGAQTLNPAMFQAVYSVIAGPTLQSDTLGVGNVKLSFYQVFLDSAYKPTGEMVLIILSISPDKFLSGEPITIQNLTTCGIMLFLENYNNPSKVRFDGVVTGGTLTLTQSGMDPDDPIAGTFEGDIVKYY